MTILLLRLPSNIGKKLFIHLFDESATDYVIKYVTSYLSNHIEYFLLISH